MSDSIGRVAAEREPVLGTPRLWLEPLRPEHAEEMAPLLADAALYEFTGGAPDALDELRRRYRRQARGHSPDGKQEWLNWIVRLRSSDEPVGTVQATITRKGAGVAAELAWVIASPRQGRGYATEAAAAMARWVGELGASGLAANIHPGHAASMAVAGALGLAPTDEVIDGEIRWVSTPLGERRPVVPRSVRQQGDGDGHGDDHGDDRPALPGLRP